MLSGNSLRQTVHTHCASVHQAAKLVATLLRVAGVTAGLAESNGSLPPGLWLTSPAGWLPRTGISSGTLRSVIEYTLPLPFYIKISHWQTSPVSCPYVHPPAHLDGRTIHTTPSAAIGRVYAMHATWSKNGNTCCQVGRGHSVLCRRAPRDVVDRPMRRNRY